ncbi:zinc finger CCCH domain-containing protein 13-like [Euwallacea similis]|uniref:zinc finger CCCH domain-containing protein 13-like n=1 Tax=Euwallacea similis TaxID=1736056 RepID=UPI00344E19C4
MNVSNKVPESEEEDELEALRLAALQTLKKSSLGPVSNAPPNSVRDHIIHTNSHRFGSTNEPHGFNRFSSGRGNHFQSSRQVSRNLIPLTPSQPKDVSTLRQPSTGNKSTFPLVQDKHKGQISKPTDSISEKPVSKFDRYKDTDKSDEEDSEDELLKSDSDDEDDCTLKLERSDSLEALMQQLDDEIQGNVKEDSELKVKTKNKKARDGGRVEGNKNLGIEDNVLPSSTETKTEEQKEGQEKEYSKPEKSEIIVSSGSPDSEEIKEKLIKVELYNKKRSLSPSQRKNYRNFKRGRGANFTRQPPQIPPFIPANGPPIFHPNIPPPIFNNTPFQLSNSITPIPPFYEKTLPPLLINAETLQTQTMAPLSPRSARFVLENRAIIEKRKRSPRRSYSRSPSPRERSLTPRRRSLSPSPIKRAGSPIRRRSNSPLRKRSPSPLRKRSRSPRKRSISPRRRSLSPKRRNFSPKQRPLSPRLRNFSPKRRSPSPSRRSQSPRRRDRKDPPEVLKNKPSVRDRLGLRQSKPEETDTKTKSNSSPLRDEKPLDPILEARKKKFESKEINVKEGIIRLKPKDEPKLEIDKCELDSQVEITTAVEPHILKTEEKLEQPKQETIDDFLTEESVLEDELYLDAHLDLFSDGSFSENDYKVKEKPDLNPLNEPRERKSRHGTVKTRSEKERRRSSRDRQLAERKSPVGKSKSSPKGEKSASKRLRVKAERHPKKFERKIEIKIKNPAKYEKTSDSEGGKEAEVGNSARKVKLGLGGKLKNLEDDDDTEIMVESDEVENDANDEGDLRAQLSKKRAEKLHKTKSSPGVTSRLLQNALENALPIKKSKKSKSKELSSCGERKLPIRLRLGIACDSDVFTKTKRKSKKRKSNDSEHQV